MLLNLFNIVYVLVAIAMTALILLQRGAGAQAGSGFGSGASGTVFGSRGATTFLSRSTAVLAALFFVLSLSMAWYLGRAGVTRPADDLGVMSGVDVPKATTPAVPAAIPAPAGDVPAAPAPAASTTAASVPIAPAPAAATTTAEKKADKKADDKPAKKQ